MSNIELRNAWIFLMALNGSSFTKIGEFVGLSKSEVHEIVTMKLLEHQVDISIQNLEAYHPAWWKSVIRKEVEQLWEKL